MKFTTYKEELEDLQISERKLKNGKSHFFVTTRDGAITSAAHDSIEKAERAAYKVASHVAYKKNILKYKVLK